MVRSSSSSVELLRHIEVNPDQYLHCTITVKVSWHKHTLHPRRCCRRASDSNYSKLFHNISYIPPISSESMSSAVSYPLVPHVHFLQRHLAHRLNAWILWLCAGILFWWTLVWCWIPPVSIIFAALFSWLKRLKTSAECWNWSALDFKNGRFSISTYKYLQDVCIQCQSSKTCLAIWADLYMDIYIYIIICTYLYIINIYIYILH